MARNNFLEKTLLFIVIVFWLSFPLGQFTRVTLSNDLRFYTIDLFLGVLALIIVVSFFVTKKEISTKLLVSWLIMIIWMIFSLFVSELGLDQHQLTIALFYLLRFVVGTIFIFVGIKLSNQKQNILYLMLVGAIGIASSGITQYIVFPYLGPIVSQGWDPHLYRLVGSFLDPGFTGIILVFGFFLTALAKSYLGLKRAAWSILLSVFYVSLLLTYSRASYLAFLAGMTIIAFRRKAFRWFGRVMLLFLFSILLLPRPAGEGIRLEREASLKARIENWSHSIYIFSQHPFTGVGYNAYRFAQEKAQFILPDEVNHGAQGSDSSWLLILATTGIVGGATFVYFILCLRDELKKTAPDNLNELVLITFSALFIHAWFLNSLFYPWVLSWVALLTGVSLNPGLRKSEDTIRR